MKHLLWLPLLSFGALLFSGCADSNSDISQNGAAGPFDEHGNYRDDWADDPTKWRRTSNKPVTQVVKNDQPPADALPIVSSAQPTRSTPPTRSTSAATAPKPKPTVASKPKPKPKPKATRYTVKQGDSLYAIAKRTGTSVSALQKANSISGSLIRPGQALVIPKR